ncbi:hypothetical protein [Methylophaga sp.]|uniref:hypothetical protein n=1 Tax=Methylophaga sp. TaxID=2024840 RepID=UPI00271CA970|nr:hypothetical protein [Methylophaga sp.]MDO8828365.1 hypothetical protein [Methylophaga sp.]
MAKKINIKDIFNGLGMPDITYVAQENGEYEEDLKLGIEERGTLCLLTGSSKTGKTTLYKRVFSMMKKEPLIVRCDSTINAEEFWKRPLERIDFDRLTSLQQTDLTEVSAGGKIGGNIGWAWLAGLIGEVSLGIKKSSSETEIREKIVSKPSPAHLIPLLKFSNAVLVVEDFHYLDENVQKEIFQQWKAFTDEEVSVLVVGTTHHGVDLAYANSDLVGRIQQIDLGRWSESDLLQIANKGFDTLDVKAPSSVLSLIAKESSGLPIITQQTCAQLFSDKKIFEFKVGAKVEFNEQDAFDALNKIASTKYKQFDSWYSRLTIGPRKRARKYDTYEILLLVFTLDPLKYELKRHEIDDRIKELNLSFLKVPPAPSINSTLSALGKFQKNNGFELFEWSKRDQVIYVLEPAFLFFLRWRNPRNSLPSLIDIIDVLLKNFSK